MSAGRRPPTAERPWWHMVVAVDVVLIAATATGSQYISPLNLAGENNPATWWSGAVYLLAALQAYRAGSDADRHGSFGWHAFALGMVLLAATEIGSLHERLGAAIAAAAALLLAIAFVLLFRSPHLRPSAFWIAGGVAAMAATVAQEWLEWSREWSGAAIGIRAAIEEGTELVGSALFLAAPMRTSQAGLAAPLTALAPAASRWRRLARVAGIGLLPAVALTWFASTRTDLIHRGNPAAFYPMAIYLLAATMALRSALQPNSTDRAAFASLFAILLFCSIDAIWTIAWNALVYYPDPRGAHTVASWSCYQPIAYAGHVALIAAWGLFRRGFFDPLRNAILVCCLAINVLAAATSTLALQLAVATPTAIGLLLVVLRSLPQPAHAPASAR